MTDQVTYVGIVKGSNKRFSFKTVDQPTNEHQPIDPGAPGLPLGTNILTTMSTQDDCGTEIDGAKSDPTDFTPNSPRAGEKPNDLLRRLYSMWPAQLTASYRPPAIGNPEATAEFNLRYIRELNDQEGKMYHNIRKKGGKTNTRDSATSSQLIRKISHKVPP